MVAEYLTVPRTARYYTHGNPATAEEIWIVLHGYGQLAQYFIRHFQPLDDGTRCIVAPEALSRFYLDAAYNRVGASWMTREDRHLEIQDQHVYLDSLLNQVQQQRNQKISRLIVLGFSQGATTAWRWVLQRQVLAQALVIWGGSVPTDSIPAAPFAQMQLVIAHGNEDKLVTTEKLTEIRTHLERSQVPYLELPYVGGHTIPPEALLHLQAQLVHRSDRG